MGRILLFEDEGHLKEDLRKDLQKEHEVIFATDCTNALGLWEQSNGKFDCIILDLNMSLTGLDEEEQIDYFPIHGILVLDKICERKIPRWESKTIIEKKSEIWKKTIVYSAYIENLEDKHEQVPFPYFHFLKCVHKNNANSKDELMNAINDHFKGRILL